MSERQGPLAHLKVVEMAGMGPAPFCAMLLADMGADVVRIERAHAPERGIPTPVRFEVLNRSRRSVALDPKTPQGLRHLLDLVGHADLLLEGYRPGVMERLGAGPDVCLARNPRLVYGRMTGFGQDGPMAQAAGHDLNYIALSGALGAIGPAGGPPTVPLNLIGDFGGGGMLLAVGLLAAYVEACRSGEGQVVDAAMTEGAALLMASTFGLHEAGLWEDERGSNILDGGAPWYGVYRTADGRFVSLAAIEPRFYADLLRRLGLDAVSLPARDDREQWPVLRAALASRIAQRTRDEWQAELEGTDACFAPVLGLGEAADHPQMTHRAAFVDVGGVRQPAPAPRFGRTLAAHPRPPREHGQDTAEVLADWLGAQAPRS
jgi:alpha-methylacyl-CoA racemase